MILNHRSVLDLDWFSLIGNSEEGFFPGFLLPISVQLNMQNKIIRASNQNEMQIWLFPLLNPAVFEFSLLIALNEPVTLNLPA